MKVETAAEQLLFSTLRIETASSVGTGAIVNHKWSEDAEGPFLVTNRHVVDGSKEGKLTFTLADEAGEDTRPLLGQSHSLTLGASAWSWTAHPSDDIDISVLPLAPAMMHIRDQGIEVFYKSIPTDLIPDDEATSDLDAVEEILFVGYPSGIYDSANNLPIARKGITATPVSVDYEAKPLFLIDASVFPGSSGSPVFLYNIGTWNTRTGPVMGGQRLFLLGILSRVYQHEASNVLRFEEVPTEFRPVIKTAQMIDLGIVYKARTVVEAIEHLLRQRGELPAGSFNGSANQ